MSHNLDEETRAIVWPWQKPKQSERFRVNWLLLFVGVLLVAAAAVMEHPAVSEISPPQVHVVDVESLSLIFSWKSLISLLKELGFALIIAWAVSYLIEQHAKRREHEAHEAARKQMASDVVHAVFGLQHLPAYVRTVVETTLQCRVIRKHYSADYTIEHLSVDEAKRLGVKRGRFVKLTQISSYTFNNVSPAPVKHAIKYALPVRAGTKLHDFAGITKIRIDGKEFSGKALDKAVTSKKDGFYKSYQWDRTIDPDKEIEVVVEAVSLKELSDTEVWGNYHATYEGMVMTVRSEVPEIATFGIRCLTATDSELVHETPGKTAQWKIEGPILPNDSVVFWWRSAEDDGTPPSTPQKPSATKKGAGTAAAEVEKLGTAKA